MIRGDVNLLEEALRAECPGLGRQSPYDLARRLLNRKLDKDTWRLRYGEFLDIPLDKWPEGAKTYPLIDAEVTYQIWEIQEAHKDFLHDRCTCRALGAFAPTLMV